MNASEVECSVEALVVRIGLGYVSGLAKADAEAIVAERERGGRYSTLGELASRGGATRDALERLAWAGACADLEGSRREALWRLGVAGGAARGGQLSLPLSLPDAPELAGLGGWESAVADYATTGMTLGAHPLELMRPDLEGLATSSDLARLPDGSELEIAGIVVARQRPATARGVVFMLLEDEFGSTNVVVLPPVYASCRLAVRTASFARVRGRLERREGVINVVADRVAALATPDMPLAGVRSIEPNPQRETGRERDAAGDVAPERKVAAAGALAAVAPAPHSFGRRG